MSPRMERRKCKRFVLSLPFVLTHQAHDRVLFRGRTVNVSSGGVLFIIDRELKQDDRLEYVITLSADGSESVDLRCVGRVLRVALAARRQVEIAATLERYEFQGSDGASKNNYLQRANPKLISPAGGAERDPDRPNLLTRVVSTALWSSVLCGPQ